MMGRIRAALRSGAMDFAGILVFYGLLWTLGLKWAIAGTIVFLVLDVVRRWQGKLGFPRLYVLSGALVVVFGAVDLYSADPFMIKYEAPISSLVLAGVFAFGARGKSMIQELAEQREGEPYDDSPDIRRFFQLLTLIWAAYFALKSAVYVWMGEFMPLERLLAVRPVVGMVSLGAMVLLMTQGRRLFMAFRALGLLPPNAGEGSGGGA